MELVQFILLCIWDYAYLLYHLFLWEQIEQNLVQMCNLQLCPCNIVYSLYLFDFIYVLHCSMVVHAMLECTTDIKSFYNLPYDFTYLSLSGIFCNNGFKHLIL